jgi:hypothetical protein
LFPLAPFDALFPPAPSDYHLRVFRMSQLLDRHPREELLRSSEDSIERNPLKIIDESLHDRETDLFQWSS